MNINYIWLNPVISGRGRWGCHPITPLQSLERSRPWPKSDVCGLGFRFRNTQWITLWVFPKIGVPPKSSLLLSFPCINHPFWGPIPIFGNVHGWNEELVIISLKWFATIYYRSISEFSIRFLLELPPHRVRVAFSHFPTFCSSSCCELTQVTLANKGLCWDSLP